MPHRTLMSLNTLALSPSSQNLWRVVLIRLLVLLAQSISVMAAYLSGWFPLPWTPLLITAAAIIVETGGILSHASTVAREFGVPGVVMVRDATRLIETGQKISVDGRAGTVILG